MVFCNRHAVKETSLRRADGPPPAAGVCGLGGGGAQKEGHRAGFACMHGPGGIDERVGWTKTLQMWEWGGGEDSRVCV